jgi:hypothetical protein
MRRGAVGEAPSISYMEGALRYCARQTDYGHNRHAGNADIRLCFPIRRGQRIDYYRAASA